MDTHAAPQLDRVSALVVIDMQQLTAANAISVPLAEVSSRVDELVGRFRARALPIVFATSTGMPPGRNAGGGGARRWPEESLAFVDGLDVRVEDLHVARAGLSVFAGTGLDAALRAGGVTQVVLVGIATTFGIESSARAAYDLGYNVTVVIDAVSDPRPSAHHHAISNLFPAFAETVTTEDVLNLLAV